MEAGRFLLGQVIITTDSTTACKWRPVRKYGKFTLCQDGGRMTNRKKLVWVCGRSQSSECSKMAVSAQGLSQAFHTAWLDWAYRGLQHGTTEVRWLY